MAAANKLTINTRRFRQLDPLYHSQNLLVINILSRLSIELSWHLTSWISKIICFGSFQLEKNLQTGAEPILNLSRTVGRTGPKPVLGRN